jgi:hypothetical protein
MKRTTLQNFLQLRRQGMVANILGFFFSNNSTKQSKVVLYKFLDSVVCFQGELLSLSWIRQLFAKPFSSLKSLNLSGMLPLSSFRQSTIVAISYIFREFISLTICASLFLLKNDLNFIVDLCPWPHHLF